MTTGSKQFWKGRQLVQCPMSCGQHCPACHRHVSDVCCEGPSDRLSVPSSWEGGSGGGLRTHPHRAPISAPTQGVARITCSCPYPTHISLSLFLGPWRIVQPRLHSTSTCVLSGKGGQSHHGWLPTQRGVVCEQGGEEVSGGPDTSPPTHSRQPTPPPRLCFKSLGGKEGKHPPPQACHHPSQPFLPGPPTSGNSWDTLPSGGSLAPKPRAGNILSLS